jgi:hypothetical protein
MGMQAAAAKAKCQLTYAHTHSLASVVCSPHLEDGGARGRSVQRGSALSTAPRPFPHVQNVSRACSACNARARGDHARTVDRDQIRAWVALARLV